MNDYIYGDDYMDGYYMNGYVQGDINIENSN